MSTDADVQVTPMAAYPLALTVQYEPGKAWEPASHGFAVISLGDFVVGREPLHPLSDGDVDRLDLYGSVWSTSGTGASSDPGGEQTERRRPRDRRNGEQE